MPTARGKGGFISKGIDPVQAPNAPTIGSVSGGSGSASVDATAPTDVGGAAIDQYVARSTDGTAVATSVTPPLAFSGLTNGQSYQFEVLAENVFGPSQYSAASASVTPEAVSVEDVFSTYLYDGNGSTQTITNGIDLDGEGGLVWIKNRTFASNHILTDSERGINSQLRTNETGGAEGNTTIFDSFNSDGFSLDLGNSNTNSTGSGEKYVSWTFRKAPKFFDVVTYTGNGTAGRTVAHNLGSVPGCMFVKRLNTTGQWNGYHRGVNGGVNPANYNVWLNLTNAASVDSSAWNNTAPTSTEFTLGDGSSCNASGSTYVAYLFAHNDDDGNFGPTEDQDIIKCGSYTGNGSTGQLIDLGFEPQWVMIKRTDTTNQWVMVDNMRGFFQAADNALCANTSNAEAADVSVSGAMQPSATGFTLFNTNSAVNASGGTYIYIAIRRGPMKTPESGTEVFDLDFANGVSAPTYDSAFSVDAYITAGANGRVDNRLMQARLTGERSLKTNVTDAEISNSGAQFDFSTGVGGATNSDYLAWMFRRAPGFFDVVAYEGTGSATTVSHNLGVVPEMMWVKNRDTAYAWKVYHSTPGETKFAKLSDRDAFGTATAYWNDTAPTDSVFTVGTGVDVNASGDSIIAYLFATLPGISKVGSYTGNGSSQTIDCGFSAGARFVLTKRTNTTGNWNVWDSERGIVAGNDPRLELNTTDAEDTGHDYIDPDNSGFIVNYVADDDDDSNVDGDTYIFLAIA